MPAPTPSPANPDDLAALPRAVAEPKRKRSLQLVWIIPLVAALIGGWLAVKAILSHGPTVTISFLSAEGLDVGKTKIKYKDVEIGVVKHIGLSPDRQRVIATAELSPEAAEMLVDDTRFWVVKPRVAAGGISGLGTLISGAYIGMDVGKSTNKRSSFKGLEVQPIITEGTPGRQFTLHAREIGSLDIGSPVYYRRIAVGQVTAYQLDPDGKGVTLKVFINDPYQRYVHIDTRFWHASGIDVSVDANGVRLQTESLTTLLVGGIAFQDAIDNDHAQQAAENATFRLASDKIEAMKQPDTGEQRFVMYFQESLRGLTPGAPIDFRGIVIGEVLSVNFEYDADTKTMRFPVDIAIYPQRLQTRNRKGNAPDTNPNAVLDSLVARGLRAQLRTGNLLTGQLYVALDFFPKAPKATVDHSVTPLAIPTMQGSLGELQNTVTEVAQKINKIPFDDISNDLKHAIGNLDQAINSTNALVKRLDGEVAPQVTATMTEAQRTMAEAQRTLQSAGKVLNQDAPVQTDLRSALQDVSRAADSMRALTDYLERHPEALLRGKAKEE